jgi:multimeric flavodoxin WrbA
MKKVLVLSASPRREGNSEILCRQFMKGAGEAGHQTEMIRLYDQKIGFCRACYACFRTGTCVLKDDMEEILTKMQEADVLVLSTPTYFLTMNGMMKTFIDRLLPRWQDLGGHEVWLIITGHDDRQGLLLAGEELTRIFTALGNEVRGTIWGEGVWQKGEVRSTKAMEEACQAGRTI